MQSKLKPIIFLLFLSFLQPAITFAKEKEFAISEVKKSDLSNKPFKDYPEAKARILFDFGKLMIEPSGDDFATLFSRHLRIKFLGDTSLSPYSLNLDFYNEVEQIIIYSLRDNKVEATDITQKWAALNKFEPFSKTLNELKPGDILEFKFKIKINSPHVVPGWQFEYEIPVRWSELYVEVPDIFVYRPVFKGYIPLLINTGEIKLDKNGEWVEGDGYYVYRYRFAIENIPPFKTVPFSPSSRNYLTAVDFYLEKIQAYKGKNSTVGKTWGELTTALSRAEKLGMRIEEFDGQPILAEMNLGPNIESKVGYIYYWLKDKVTWNGEIGIVAERSLDEVLKSGSGSVAEINLLLVALLKQAGVEASPVLLRTVELGNLNMALPQISQFNYLVAYTRYIDIDILMDVSEPCLEPGLLRVSCLNGKGLNVNSRFEDWIDLESNRVANKRVTVQAEIKGDSLIATIIEKRKNYYALEDCHDFNNGLEIIKYNPALKVLDISYANMDSLLSGNKIIVKCDATALMQKEDQSLSVSPFWFESIDENPFNEKERLYPISFPYLFSDTWNFTLTIPDGYKVSEIPDEETIITPDNLIRFIYTTKHMGNIIQVSAQMSILLRQFDPESYEDIRTFYKEVIKKMKEPIEVKKDK